jgi:hypothetical protein
MRESLSEWNLYERHISDVYGLYFSLPYLL